MLCKILQDFNGSQDGLVATFFEKGSVVDVSDYLMSCINKNWVQPAENKTAVIEEAPIISNKAIVSDGRAKPSKSK